MTTSSPVRMAELAQRTLTKEGGEGFTMEQAILFAYCGDGFRLLATADDIYEALFLLPHTQNLKDAEQGIGIITTGWASPLGANGQPEGAPSEHPERQRVRLCSCVERDGKMGSALSFERDPDDLVTDEGEATGSLAEALYDALIKLVAKNN